MPRCYRHGYLVDATAPLPIEPSEHDVSYLPPIGCSHIVCERCGARVRSQAGVAFATQESISRDELAAIYALDDLLQSPRIHRVQDTWRLYVCRCDRYLATGEVALVTDDPDDAAGKPWHCAEHPVASLPLAIGDVTVRTEAELREQTREGLRGHVPGGTRDVDREDINWLLRVHARVEPALAAAMAEVGADLVEDAAPDVRARSLRFLYFAATTATRERVLSLLQGHSPLLDASTTTRVTPRDRTLADLAWHVVAPLVGADTPGRTYARGEALAGRGSRTLYDVLAAHDSAWLLDNLERVAQAAPLEAGALADSLSQLPEALQRTPHADRIRTALFPPDAPIDALRQAVRAHSDAVRRDVPATGPMAPMTLALPPLADGTQLALEVTAAGADRALGVRVRSPRGSSVWPLFRGTKSELVSFLRIAQVGDRVLYACAKARR